MLIAKKLFSFHYCYTGKKNLTIQQITKEVKYKDKKNYILFPLKERRVKQPISKNQQATKQLQWPRHGSQHIYFISFTLIRTRQKEHQNA